MGETKSNEIKLSLTESATTEQKQRVEETVTNIQDLPITEDRQIKDFAGGLQLTSDKDGDKLITTKKKTD